VIELSTALASSLFSKCICSWYSSARPAQTLLALSASNVALAAAPISSLTRRPEKTRWARNSAGAPRDAIALSTPFMTRSSCCCEARARRSFRFLLFAPIPRPAARRRHRRLLLAVARLVPPRPAARRRRRRLLLAVALLPPQRPAARRRRCLLLAAAVRLLLAAAVRLLLLRPAARRFPPQPAVRCRRRHHLRAVPRRSPLWVLGALGSPEPAVGGLSCYSPHPKKG
jgi:hypothetical protein